MDRNEYKQYLKLQALGKYAPPHLNDHVKYYYLRKPNWERLFKEHSKFPSEPNEIKKSNSLGNYLIFLVQSVLDDIGPAIGFFMLIGVPILIVDFLFSKGLLTLSILGVGYFFYSKNIAEENHYIEKEMQSYKSKYEEWKRNIEANLSRFRNDQFFELESYPDNQVGKSAPKFYEKLKQSGISGLLEAIPKGNPYQFRNGVYSVDIGYVDQTGGVLLDVEVDEDHHFSDFEQWKRDQHRNTFFSEQGWAVVRFSESEIIDNPDHCIRDIVNVVSELKNDFDDFMNNMKSHN